MPSLTDLWGTFQLKQACPACDHAAFCVTSCSAPNSIFQQGMKDESSCMVLEVLASFHKTDTCLQAKLQTK